jgi:hypothetical protein
VSKGEVQLGLFGVARGDFLSPQLIRVPWTRRGSQVAIGPSEPITITGLHYPHNTHLRPDGTVLACSSGEGSFIVGSRRLTVGGWPRGIAIDRLHYYVGISSSSYPALMKDEEPAPEGPAEIVRVCRTSFQVTGTFSFQRLGQIYDLRLAQGEDFGMSQFRHLDAAGHGSARLAG